MEDLKQIQEFFSKPLNENVFVEAFKLQKALKGMGYDVKVKAVDDFGTNVFEIYFNNPADADDSIYYDVEKLGYDNVRVFANPQESVKENSRFEKRLAKMAADEKEKRAKNPKYAAASKLDVDVEDFFKKGQSYQEFKKRLDKLKEYNSGIYYDPARDNTTGRAEKTKEASKTGIEKVKDMIKKIMTENEEDVIDTITMDVPLFIRMLEYAREDAENDMDLHDVAEKAIAATKQQGMLSMDDYD